MNFRLIYSRKHSKGESVKNKPFYDRYVHFGGFRKIVPQSSAHLRELSTQVKKKIRLLKADLSKKPLVDSLTGQPVPAMEYLEWRRRVRAEIRDGEKYLELLAQYSRKAKGGKNIRPALY